MHILLKIIFITLVSLFIFQKASRGEVKTDKVQAFKDQLAVLAAGASNELIAFHYQSILNVIEAQKKLYAKDSTWIGVALKLFTDTTAASNAISMSSYLNRERPLIIAWMSPAHNVISFARLKLPKDWDPAKTYPLYVDLHGLWDVCDRAINYLTYSYRVGPTSTFAYEDGYHLMPWGRGNYWYQSSSEIDIFEAVAFAEDLLNIDPEHEYLAGHSMGGFGTWYLAGISSNKWAAIGIHAGALSYGADRLYNQRLKELSHIPAYFVVGNSDGFYQVNLEAADTLRKLGNQNVEFVSFNGGHVVINANVENMYMWLRQFKNTRYLSIDQRSSDLDNMLSFYPNPIQREATFRLNSTKSEQVSINLYNTDGHRVATIFQGNVHKGKTAIRWNRNNLPPGIYFCTCITGTACTNIRLILE